MARIRLYIARHLCTAPRPQKEATALAAAGHEVSIHGVSYRADFAARDRTLASGQSWRWEPVVDYAPPWQRLAWAWTRFRHQRARRRYQQAGRIEADVWSYANRLLQAHALHAPAELTIAHAEGSLWFARELHRRGHRVGVDFEDWFSRDLALSQRQGRPVKLLAELEAYLLSATPYALATSAAMAQAMADAYGTPPAVPLYNSFSETHPPAPRVRDPQAPIRLHWFSLVLGPERGLETLFDALPALSGNWALHLRGEAQPGYAESLRQRLPAHLQPRIHFLSTVPTAQLPEYIAENDIGLALDRSDIPSRNLTVTNKLFQYLQAGLAVLASDTAGHREVLDRAPACGAVFRDGDPDAIAAALNPWLAQPDALASSQRAARQAYLEYFAHDRQSHRYAELAAQALDPSASA